MHIKCLLLLPSHILRCIYDVGGCVALKGIFNVWLYFLVSFDVTAHADVVAGVGRLSALCVCVCMCVICQHSKAQDIVI